MSADLRVFQIYYDEATRAALDPDFTPLDNSANDRPDWAEYWAMRRVLASADFPDSTWLGFFSPRFREKTGLSGREVIEAMRSAEGEVVSFSPYFDQNALFENAFVQGDNYHRGLLGAGQGVAHLLGLEVDLSTLVADHTTTIFANYFIARAAFWRRWFPAAERLFAFCEGGSGALRDAIVAGTRHRGMDVWPMKVFLMERLVCLMLEHEGMATRLALPFERAPCALPGARECLAALAVCDALKGQYRRTRNEVFLRAWRFHRGEAVAIIERMAPGR